MTFREANGILAHRDKHTKIEVLDADCAFGVVTYESKCNYCDRQGNCAMEDSLDIDEIVKECNFYDEGDTPEEDYDTYD